MNEFKVGLLTLASIAAMVFMSFKVTRNQAGLGGYITYQAILDDATGIFPKTRIKVAGINAGKIVSLQLKGRKAHIIFEVISEVVVSQGSVLKVKSLGMLGDKYLDIDLGAGETPLPEESFIPAEGGGGGVSDLASHASEAMNDLKAILKTLRETLAPNGGESPVKMIVDDLSASLANLKDLTQNLKGLLQENREKLVAIIDNFEELSSSMANEFDEQNPSSLLIKLREIGPLIEDARVASADLKTIMEDMKEGKGTVGKLLRDEQIADQVSQTLSGVQRMVNRFNAIRSELAMGTNVNTEGNNRSDLNLSIYPAPERFYVLGMSTSEVGVESEKEITTTQNGSSSTLTRKEVDKNSFKFNLQIGRELQKWRFRVGLIESSGGLGVDYNIPTWGTRLSFEAFDYRKRLGPNLRLMGQVHLWNIFYGNVAVEDMISKEDEEALTVGAGVRFSDEDLRSLIGLFL